MVRAKGPFELNILKVDPVEEGFEIQIRNGLMDIPKDLFHTKQVELGVNFDMITYYLSLMNHDPLLLEWNYILFDTKWGKVPDSEPDAPYQNFRIVLGITILELGAVIMGQHLDLTLSMRYVQDGQWILETPQVGALWSVMNPYIYMYSDWDDYCKRVLRIINTFEGDPKDWDTLVESAVCRFYNRKETLAIPWIYARFKQWEYPMCR